MTKISRRKLIAAAAAPLAGALNGGTRNAKADPVIAKVCEWMAARDAHDALGLEWQKQEKQLLAKTRGAMNMTQAARTKLAEARAMRLLDKRIAADWKRLKRAAGRIVLMRPTTTAGALAKIEMALRIQGPYDWEDYAYALMQDGYEQLRDRL